MTDSKMKLSLAFGKALRRARPRNWKEQIALNAAPTYFKEWISSLTDAEAEEIRVEMVTTLL